MGGPGENLRAATSPPGSGRRLAVLSEKGREHDMAEDRPRTEAVAHSKVADEAIDRSDLNVARDGAVAADAAGPVLAEGVDEEPVESNRRLFAGWRHRLVIGFAALYAAFHMVALNGVSIREWTGVTVPFLPTFPLETWNFRTVHIAGALMLGFALFAAVTFRADDGPATQAKGRSLRLIGLALLVPVAIALWTSIQFIVLVNSGTLPEFGGIPTWSSAQPGAPLYDQEFWGYGVPLLVATFGGIVLGWFERPGRGRIAVSDLVLGACAVLVALYLVPVYSTAARNAVGTPYVPIGIAFAATAGCALILELTRRVAGLALVVISGVFLVYVFTAHMLPGILAVDRPYSWQRFFGHVYSDAGILGPTTAVSSTYIILFIIFARR